MIKTLMAKCRNNFGYKKCTNIFCRVYIFMLRIDTEQQCVCGICHNVSACVCESVHMCVLCVNLLPIHLHWD